MGDRKFLKLRQIIEPDHYINRCFVTADRGHLGEPIVIRINRKVCLTNTLHCVKVKYLRLFIWETE